MTNKRKVKDEKYKKLLMSFWFWVIVALVSYLIMIMIPIQWGEGLDYDRWAGTNAIGTFFAYLTQIAWIIAIVILIINLIKWIQKTKIGDYWKISFTILGIVGIIAYVFYALSGMGIFDNLSNEYDNRIGETDKGKVREIKLHIGLLEEDGYEVLYFGELGILEGDPVKPYVKMKALGNRQTQVRSGLFALERVYPTAPEYTIKILEESQACFYDINGTIYRALYEYSEDFDFSEALKDIEEYKKSDVYIFGQYIDYQIDNPYCL